MNVDRLARTKAVDPEPALLPCPFCGGRAAMHGAIYMSRKFPACTQCGAERASVEQWNQRPERDPRG